MQKNSVSERHLLERILQRWILTRRKLKQLLLAASTAWFFQIDVLIFERSREIDWGKKYSPTSYQTRVTTKQTQIWAIQCP